MYIRTVVNCTDEKKIYIVLQVDFDLIKLCCHYHTTLLIFGFNYRSPLKGEAVIYFAYKLSFDSSNEFFFRNVTITFH